MADFPGFEPRDDRQQVAYWLREPIEFGANKLVALTDEIERRLKLLTLR